MAEPLAELGHIGLDTVDAFVEAGEVAAEETEKFVSHSTSPRFHREKHTMRGALAITSCQRASASTEHADLIAFDQIEIDVGAEAGLGGGVDEAVAVDGDLIGEAVFLHCVRQ